VITCLDLDHDHATTRQRPNADYDEGGLHFVSPFVPGFFRHKQNNSKEIGRRVDAKRAHFLSPTPGKSSGAAMDAVIHERPSPIS
jgi:hypothetical protein